MRTLLFGLASAVLLAACQTVPESIPEGLSQPELFQRAQDAYSEGNYAAAELYYETFLERFPEDQPNRIAAEYEIAYIHYKRGNLDEAERRFRDILARYEEAEQSAGGQSAEGQSTDGQGSGSREGQGEPPDDSFGATRAPGAQGGALPAWPRVLSERLIEIIEKERNESDALFG